MGVKVAVGAGVGVAVGERVAVGSVVGGRDVAVAVGGAACGPQALKIRARGSKTSQMRDIGTS